MFVAGVAMSRTAGTLTGGDRKFRSRRRANYGRHREYRSPDASALGPCAQRHPRCRNTGFYGVLTLSRYRHCPAERRRKAGTRAGLASARPLMPNRCRQKETRSRQTEKAPDRVQHSPLTEQTARGFGGSIQSRVQQAMIRGHDGNQRERNDGKDERRSHEPQNPAVQPPREKAGDGRGQRESYLHRSRPLITRAKHGGRQLGPTGHASGMFGHGDVERGAAEYRAAQHRNEVNHVRHAVPS